MDRKAIEKIISLELLEPYLEHHPDIFQKAVAHYKAITEISVFLRPAKVTFLQQVK